VVFHASRRALAHTGLAGSELLGAMFAISFFRKSAAIQRVTPLKRVRRSTLMMNGCWPKASIVIPGSTAVILHRTQWNVTESSPESGDQ
jgi:hypothetical protein